MGGGGWGLAFRADLMVFHGSGKHEQATEEPEKERCESFRVSKVIGKQQSTGARVVQSRFKKVSFE